MLMADIGPVFNARYFPVAHIAQFSTEFEQKRLKTLSEMNKLPVEIILAKAVIQKWASVPMASVT